MTGVQTCALPIYFIDKGFEKISIYQVTGLPEINGYCPIAKVLWVKNNLPDLYSKTEKFLLLEDYLILRLCGIYVSNPSLMCSTGYFNIHSDLLWDEMLRYCGISAEKFPPIAASGTIAGKILGSVADELGLSPEVMITTGAMDQVASAVGSGNTSVGIVSETTGTAQVVAATCEKYLPQELSSVTIYRHAVADAFLKIVINQTAGIAYKWFRDEFCVDLMGPHADAFVAMGALAEKEPVGSRGLVFFPHMTGMQFPQSDETLRGVFFGVGLDTNRGCFIRAIMEGVGFMLRESIEEMNLMPESIFSLGGGAKSALWSQIKADISGIKITILEQPESTSLGAAVMGCIAMGIYRDYQTAVKALVKKDEFQPDPASYNLYQPAYAEYQAMYGLFSPLFKNRKNRS